MHSGCLEGRTGVELKRALFLDRFEIASKSNIKIKGKKIKALST